MTARRLAPLTGVVAVALIVLAAIIGGETPDLDAPGTEVLSFYTEDEGAQFAANILGAYAALFFVFFTGVLRSALRRGEGDTGTLSALAFGGGLLVALGIAIFSGLGFTLADTAEDIDPAAAQALHVLSNDFFFPVAVGVATLMLSAGLAIVKTAALPRWLGWVALLIGVVSLTPIGFFAFIATGAWTILASIVLSMRAGEPAAP